MAQEELALGAFRLDLVQRRLSHEGHPVELKAKAFDILCVLAAARGAVVSKDELMAKVWPGLVGEENRGKAQGTARRQPGVPRRPAGRPGRSPGFTRPVSIACLGGCGMEAGDVLPECSMFVKTLLASGRRRLATASMIRRLA